MIAAELERLHSASGGTLRIWSAKEYAVLLKDPTTVLVQEAYCFAIGRLVEKVAELLMIGVEKQQQQKGRGRHCLQSFETALIIKGAISCYLEVAENNKIARNLYIKQGYKEIGRRNSYYQITACKRIDAIIMQKNFA